MEIKFTDSELKVMDVLWEMGEGNALAMVTTLMERVGWSKSTAYTVLQKAETACRLVPDAAPQPLF